MFRLVQNQPGMSGASADYGNIQGAMKERALFARGQRQSLNVVAIAISLFLPWLIFCSMYWTMCFNLHYANPFFCYLLLAVGLGVVGITGYYAFNAVTQKIVDPQREPTWLLFLFGTCFLAWLVGVMAGDANYLMNMQPYYDVIHLNQYQGVEPLRNRGQQLMDAGRVTFSSDSSVDVKRSMGFMNLDVYCVAPIVNGKDPKHMPTYDFWAVGMNCCSSNHADFHCGEFNNAFAKAGLRLMHDDQRPFYRLAVQQAEAAFNIRADHPLFFYWMQDPVGKVNDYWDEGTKYYLIGLFSHFIFQFFLVSIACIAFSKLGRPIA